MIQFLLNNSTIKIKFRGISVDDVKTNIGFPQDGDAISGTSSILY